jgi:patatin-like phospholipase/acyl hydrolase
MRSEIVPYRTLTRDQHFAEAGPKRILALDGGGLRGILTLGILRQVENVLRERHGDQGSFRLCHYFDLIAGTSTGAIIAAALALGMSVDEVIRHYQQLGREVFCKDWLRYGILRARYDEAALVDNLKRVFGERATLGDPAIKTGLLIMTKRFDTGSPWPLGNNPNGRYFRAGADARWISNADYPLWQVVRASTAAPSYFDPERITIAAETGKTPVEGTFVDGGVSPFNNPSLQALMYATMCGYRVNWKTSPDQLLLVSVGTGMSDPSQAPSRIAAKGAVAALFSLMDDCAALVETTMQWMSDSPTARVIDREMGDCTDDVLGGMPLLSYVRYNTFLTAEHVRRLELGLSGEQVGKLGEMDNPDNLDALLKIGEAVGTAQVSPAHFRTGFDLQTEAAGPSGGRKRYVKRANQAVVAVQLALEGAGFSYEKWGGRQKCKAGDWLVNNNGDIYTVDAESFARTYQRVGDGKYVKTAPVWAEVAKERGRVETKEGSTEYQRGDYLVFNEEDGGDAYAVSAGKFEEMYESSA